jgi:hypothetical protein
MTADDLTVAEVLVDPQRLTRLPPGARLFWQVDAIFPGGRSSSPTFVTTVN